MQPAAVQVIQEVQELVLHVVLEMRERNFIFWWIWRRFYNS
jgi:hypothetical protein